MFNVVDAETAKQIESTCRIRGAMDAFLNNLDECYQEWITDPKNADRTFMVSLTKNEGDPFHGKNTPSVYSSLNGRIAKLELKQTWRVMKQKEDIYIAHL